MNTQLIEISGEDLTAVQGGHFNLKEGLGLFVIINIPHVLMGGIEFYNYVADRVVNGCSNVEEKDYFTHSVCWGMGKTTG